MSTSRSAARPDWRLREAARYLYGGGIVACPTEAVYGLGCDPGNADAVLRLLQLKRRPLAPGLILIGARFEHLAPWLGELTQAMVSRTDKTWPGPHTWLLPAAPGVPAWICGAHTTVAVRITAHPLAAALCDAFGGALVSTSANRHGRPPARSLLQLRLQFADAIDYIVPGPLGPSAKPTVIRDGASGRVIRPG